MRFHGMNHLRVAGVLAVIDAHGCDTNAIARGWIKYMGLQLQSFVVTVGIMVVAAVVSDTTCVVLGQSKWTRWSVT